MTTRSKALKQYIEEAQDPVIGSHAPGFVVQLYDMVNNSPPEMISVSRDNCSRACCGALVPSRSTCGPSTKGFSEVCIIDIEWTCFIAFYRNISEIASQLLSFDEPLLTKTDPVMTVYVHHFIGKQCGSAMLRSTAGTRQETRRRVYHDYN